MEEPTVLKEKLKASTERHRQAFENELDHIATNIEKTSKTVLWVGGGLVLGYQIYRLLRAKNGLEGKSPEATKQLPARQQKQSITQDLIDELAIYLLGVVKKKLIEFLEKNTDGSKPVQNNPRTK